MFSFPGAERGLGQQSSPHSCFVLFQLFSGFFLFIFFTFFLKLSCGCDVFMFIVGIFFVLY